MTDTKIHVLVKPRASRDQSSSRLWNSITVDSLAKCTAILDWAEAQGFRERQLEILGESQFRVKWR